MRWLKFVFVFHWRYKLSALLVSFVLWGVVNFGNRTIITLPYHVELVGAKEGFSYSVVPDRVELTLYVVERLLFSKSLRKVRVYVDVSPYSEEGSYTMKVRAETPAPFLIQPAGFEPQRVKVVIIRKRMSYRNRRIR